MSDEKSQLSKNEEEVLDFWQKENIFQKSVEKDAPNGEFVFHDGPPFATGLPHYGHLLQSFVKDVVPRYKTMQGYKVERKWGWDCHGLPIENIVEKDLGVSGREEILEKVGVKEFNRICRTKIFEYDKEWQKIIPRIGRWADMEHPYKTMDTDYMESEWWAFKSLYEKGLVYEDFRSIHICPRCETTLSQSEVTEGYADIKDISVVVKFELEDEPGTYLLAWTTTPWTLPGNVAVAINKNIEYVKVAQEGSKYILAKSKVEKWFNDLDYEIVGEIKVEDLLGRKYKPLFDYYKDTDLEHKENIYKIVHADFITEEDGTGIAHEAPAFGADDMELAKIENLPFIQHVDMTGKFKPEVKDFAGMQVKPKGDHMATDVEIIKYLANKNLLFAKEKIEHSYPHCWRCDTPLLNYATTSWFVSVEQMKEELLHNAKDIYWYPHHIKDGRWGTWLTGAKDWSISRNRFWANTIPVWRCVGNSDQDSAEGCRQQVVVGSIDELEKYSGTKVDDLHKDIVDEIEWDCSCGGKMRRIPDVLDTWFNSGSVPYASIHYPFENQDKINLHVPADFIAEGQDQCRAWFYYQHVLATALFDKNAFKNVITTGIVLAEDGKKMSKKLKNYPDPMHMIDKYGADPMRLYILSSPVLRAENLAFAERDLADIYRKVFVRLLNIYEFYAMYEKDIEHKDGSDSDNALDKWIVTRFNALHKEVTEYMENYAIDKATRPIGEFVDDFSTWYIRRSRDRFKSENQDDKKQALETTRYVLRKFAKLLAPFTPFVADWLWLRVKRSDDAQSVHLANWCSVKDTDKELLEQMRQAREVVSLALDARKEAGIKVRQPLGALYFNPEEFSLIRQGDILDIIAQEVNVKEVQPKTDISGIKLDTNITPELEKEGMVREVLRAVQQARKEANLTPDKKADVTLCAPENVINAVRDSLDFVKANTSARDIILKPADEIKIEIEV